LNTAIIFQTKNFHVPAATVILEVFSLETSNHFVAILLYFREKFVIVFSLGKHWLCIKTKSPEDNKDLELSVRDAEVSKIMPA